MLGTGVDGLVRDAKIELTQLDRSDSKTDLGFVPRLHIYAERDLGNRLFISLDAEGWHRRGNRGEQ